MKYNGIIISDIHFGATDILQLKKELTEVFIYYLLNMKKIDFMIIDGDYFDHKIYLNDQVSNFAISFMDKLVSIAKKHKCPIRIVYGTESHEVNQYNIFDMYENSTDIDFKLIYTVQEEELLKDMKVLYIPEEYLFSKSEHYAKFLNKEAEYNYIFGHGVISGLMITSNTKEISKKKSTRKKVHSFTTNELSKICKGQVYFGHYHINTNVENKIFYVGSFSRWQHGETEPKGFYHVTYDISKNKYTQKFIENYMAKKYITYTYGYDSDAITSEEKLIKELSRKDKYVEASDVDNVRYIFNIPENHPNPEFIINILNERYKFNDSIKVQITNGYVEKKKKINKKQLDDMMTEYAMIFDKSIQIEDKIVYYIKKIYDTDIKIETVKSILYNDNEGN